MPIALIHLTKDGAEPDNIRSSEHYSLLLNRIQTTHYEINHEIINNRNAVILLAPKRDLSSDEYQCLRPFINSGNAILLALGDNKQLNINECVYLNAIAESAGVKIQENFNDLSEYLIDINVHAITANINSLGSYDSGCFLKKINQDICTELALSRNPEYLMIATTPIKEKIKICVVSNANIFSDLYSEEEDNTLFSMNLLDWLSSQHPIDIESFDVNPQVTWESFSSVKVGLRGNPKYPIAKLSCILDSMTGAVIDESEQSIRNIPTDETIYREWEVKPKTLGDQRLRLVLETSDGKQLSYKEFSPLVCIADGTIIIEINNKNNEPSNHFKTGEVFSICAYYQWSTTTPPKPIEINLTLDNNLFITKEEKYSGYHPTPFHKFAKTWELKAEKSGCYKINVHINKSKQSQTVLVHIDASQDDKLAKLTALHIAPLEAEVKERLSLIDPRLVEDDVVNACFSLLSPENYAKEIYNQKDAEWLIGLVESAHLEQFHNAPLLGFILEYFIPTYKPKQGAIIPYAPDLASKLCKIHPEDRLQIEHCLLCSNENEDLEIRQRIIAYLAHEKYGHGFVSTQTKLGQQIVLLEKYQEHIEESDYAKAAERILDSSILIEEGFSAWLEIYLLEQMSAEIKQAAYLRKNMLFSENDNFQKFCEDSNFYSDFPSKYNTKYREVYEYLNFITQEISFSSALDAFMFATDIDLGITESQGGIQFSKEASTLLEMLDSTIYKNNKISSNTSQNTSCNACAHFRLQKISNYIYENLDEIKQLVQNKGTMYNDDPVPLKSIFLKAFNEKNGLL